MRDGATVNSQDEIDAIEKAITDAGGDVDTKMASGEEVTVDALEPATFHFACCASGQFDKCDVSHSFCES